MANLNLKDRMRLSGKSINFATNYYLARNWPRLWRTSAIECSLFSLIYGLPMSMLLATQTNALRANEIPDFRLWFTVFLTLSAIATIIWIIRSTKHFYVGVAGYKTAAPPTLLLAVVVSLLWLPAFLYAYCANTALKATANEEIAGSSYLRLVRVATLFDAQTHYEQLMLKDAIPALGSPDSFTADSIRSTSQAVIGAIDIFAPPNNRRTLTYVANESIPACTKNLSLTSKADAVQILQQDFSKRSELAQSNAEREAIRQEKISQLDRVDVDYDAHLRSFRDCLTRAIAEANINPEDLKQSLLTAERNAYIVYYANEGFGFHSSDYLQFVGNTDFAARGFWPFVGDLTVVAVVCWLIFLVSTIYRAMEFVDVATTVSVTINIVLVAILLVLSLSVLHSTSSIQSPTPNPLSLDFWASAMHWPSLIYLAMLCWAIAGALLPPSTYRSRALVLAAYLCLPMVLQVETLNAINTLAATDYGGGNCQQVGWVVMDRIHCSIYYVWQPLVRVSSLWVGKQFGWPQDYWNYAAARISISVIISMSVSYLASVMLIGAIKHEYVRPRDR